MPEPEHHNCQGGQGNTARDVAERGAALLLLIVLCVVAFFVARWFDA